MSGDSGDARGDTEANSPELTQFLYNGVDVSSICSLRVENRFSVVKEEDNLP